MFRYRIDVQEELSEAWSDWFEGWQVQINSVGHTQLTGAVRDQTELHGVLAKIRNLRLTLLLVQVEHEGEEIP